MRLNLLPSITVLALLASPAMAKGKPPKEPPAFAEVVYLKGLASMEPGHTNLHLGDKLKPGDRITTMSESKLRLKLGDGAALQLGPHTELVLKRKEAGIPLLQLVHGMVLSVVRPWVEDESNKDKEKFQLRTNKVSIGVRGTEFFVKQRGDEPTFLCVCSGKVHAHWEAGDTLYASEHHDHHVNIRHTKKKPEPQTDMGSDHTDDEIAALKLLL
jgi:hypothetical protein